MQEYFKKYKAMTLKMLQQKSEMVLCQSMECNLRSYKDKLYIKSIFAKLLQVSEMGTMQFGFELCCLWQDTAGKQNKVINIEQWCQI